MATGWQRDKQWSDRFVREICAICGLHLIRPAPREEDWLRNSDLMVLGMGDLRIACRVRRHQYLAEYADEITIRAGRHSGNETELSKIVSGWGAYIFYGFADASGESLAAWLLGDLNVLRSWFARQLVLQPGLIPGQHRTNGDESSWFYAYRVMDLPASFVIARHEVAETGGIGKAVAAPATERTSHDLPF